MVVSGRILTMTDVRGIRTAEEYRTWIGGVASLRTRLLQQGLAAVPPVDVDVSAPPAVARVNHGEWIVDGPEHGCGGAVHLLPGAPFFCPGCLNAGADFRWRPVTVPPRAAREAIEAVLLRQPLVHLRNWEPGIDAVTLAAEVDDELRGGPAKHVRAIRRAVQERERRAGRVRGGR